MCLPVRISLKISQPDRAGEGGTFRSNADRAVRYFRNHAELCAAAGRRARAGGADWPFAEGHEPAAASGRGGDGAHFCAQLPPRGKG